MATAKYEIKPLSPQDRKRIKNQYWLIGGFLLFSGAIFYVIFTSIISSAHNSAIPMIIFGVFGAIFVAVITSIALQNYLELRDGVKHCYTGVVTNKRVNRHTSRTGNNLSPNRAGHGGGRTRTTITHYLSINGEELRVTPKEYNDVSVGDEISLDVSPQKKLILGFEILNTYVNERVEEAPKVQKTNSSRKRRELHISHAERSLVKKLFFKQWRKKLYFFIAMFVLFFPIFTTNLILFSFPLGMVLLYKASRLLSEYNVFRRFMNTDRGKIEIRTSVKDKLTTTSNIAKTKYRLLTAEGQWEVTEEIYEKLSASDAITLYKPAHLDMIFAVSHPNEKSVLYLE
ncbi:hypothetical protein IB286_09355 [Spongiibacter sp. KMU-158]|uniref:DUF3592 domain-containing protein n=1 Tax=Spongiibacter pelagi TaxID=2760804 RepID=A0A927C3M5_9GAMM|nr:hypothetical protein [Spongiibacter pelagi]MBD2859212.1 hypothetical protein [Spongiibacter pelagi]